MGRAHKGQWVQGHSGKGREEMGWGNEVCFAQNRVFVF